MVKLVGGKLNQHLPPDTILFRWVQKDYFHPDDPSFIIPAVFQPDTKDKGMSTDYKGIFCSTYQNSLNYCEEAKRPKYGVAEIKNVAKIEKIPGLSVKHTPKPDRKSHTDVFGLDAKGKNKTFRRMKLFMLSKVVFNPFYS